MTMTPERVAELIEGWQSRRDTAPDDRFVIATQEWIATLDDTIAALRELQWKSMPCAHLVHDTATQFHAPGTPCPLAAPTDGAGLPRYGIRWNGPTQPLAVPMDDGYWTPWHLATAPTEAQEARSGEGGVYAMVTCSACRGDGLLAFSSSEPALRCPGCNGTGVVVAPV